MTRREEGKRERKRVYRVAEYFSKYLVSLRLCFVIVHHHIQHNTEAGPTLKQVKPSEEIFPAILHPLSIHTNYLNMNACIHTHTHTCMTTPTSETLKALSTQKSEVRSQKSEPTRLGRAFMGPYSLVLAAAPARDDDSGTRENSTQTHSANDQEVQIFPTG